MKKRVSSILIFCFVLALTLFVFSGCDGAENLVPTTYLSTKEDLLLLSNGGNFVLSNDIDCEGLSLQAIHNFAGNIDGNGHVIKNVKFISTNNSFGLLASVDADNAPNRTVVIKNLGLQDFLIDCTYSSEGNSLFVGGLLAHAGRSGNVTISNCFIKGRIKVAVNNVDNMIGGIVGYSFCSSSIDNCLADVEITCDMDSMLLQSMDLSVGGIVGYTNSSFNIENCVSIGSIDINATKSSSIRSTINAGGIIGAEADSGPVNVNYCISAPRYVGISPSIVSTLTGKSGNVGAIAGTFYYASNTIRYSYYCDYEMLVGSTSAIENCCSNFVGTKKSYGTAVRLEKHKLFTPDFMKGDYTFVDLDGNTKDSFLRFSEDIWNFGGLQDGAIVYPTLKIFD